MEFFGLIIIMLALVPWVFGVVSIVKKVAGQKDAPKTNSNSFDSAIFFLKQKSRTESDVERAKACQIATQYLEQADSLGATTVGIPALAQASETMPVAKTTASDQFKTLENINVLMYIGSFMVVVAAGIFIGVNYSTLTGSFKTIFLACFAMLFYLLGLGLYLKSVKLKPAGLTFATIGLIILPLVGLTYFRFIGPAENGPMIWFVTSIVVAIFYVISWLVLKKTFLAYFVTFVSLSLFESFISLFSTPVYYFAWGMTLVSIILLLISKNSSEENTKPFYFSANVILPIAMILSIYNLSFSVWQLGVNILLGALFYFSASFLSNETSQKESYFAISASLLPFGLYLILSGQNLSGGVILIVLAGLSLIYVVLHELLINTWQDKRASSLLMIGGLVSLLGSMLVLDNNTYLLCSLVFTVLVNLYSVFREKKILSQVLGFIALMFIPNVIGTFINPAYSSNIIGFIYLLVSIVTIWARIKLPAWSEKLLTSSIMCYVIALFVTFIVALSAYEAISTALILFLMTVIGVFLVILEKKDFILGFSVVLSYLTVGFVCSHFNIWGEMSSVIIFALFGFLIYLLNFLFIGTIKKILVYGGLVGVYASVLLGLNLESQLTSIIMLGFGGVLSLIESKIHENEVAKYFSSAVMVIALQWLFNFLKITEVQFYAGIWALYFGVLAYLRNLKQDLFGRKILTIIALIALNIPLFIQSFGDNGVVYGLVLGIESLILLFVGIAIKDKLVLYWAIVALIIDVLYQAGTYLFDMPKWIIVGAVGIAFLVLGTILLSSRTHEEGE